jgi:hypothetical protein
VTDDPNQGEFDLFQSRAARDEGIDLVLDHNPEFKDVFFHTILRLPRGWIGQCEDIRRDWTGPWPGHPNAWGASWNAAKRLGLLVELPDQVSMTGVKSHGRKTHLHRRT